METLTAIMALAEKHQDKNASAAVCLQDAKSCKERGLHTYAREQALKSLLHSVGGFHPDYQKALAL